MTFFLLLQVMKDQLEIYPSHQRSPKKYSVCDYTGKFKNNLKRHIQFVHEGKKGIPNKCYVWM